MKPLFQKKDVVGLSSLNVDYIFETSDLSFLRSIYPTEEDRRALSLTDPEDSKDIETLIHQKARLISKSGGGSGANTVFCLAKMGFQSGLVGKIGWDADGDYLLKELSTVPFLHLARNYQTGKALIILGPSRDRIMFLLPNANSTLTWPDLDLDFMGSFEFLHMTSLPGEGLALQERLAAEIFQRVRISFDPGEIYARMGLEAMRPILSRTEILFLTEKELELMTGFPLREAVPTVQSLGISLVAVKRKGAGASIFQGTEVWELPAEVISATDTTGAGDVFAAGFLAGWLQGQSPPHCGRIALALARQSMLGVGRMAYPGRADFDRVMKKVRLSSDS
jgi:ribokinase